VAGSDAARVTAARATEGCASGNRVAGTWSAQPGALLRSRARSRGRPPRPRRARSYTRPEAPTPSDPSHKIAKVIRDLPLSHECMVPTKKISGWPPPVIRMHIPVTRPRRQGYLYRPNFRLSPLTAGPSCTPPARKDSDATPSADHLG